MGKGGASQSYTVDPRSQGYIDNMRTTARRASGVALNNPGSFVPGADPRSIEEQAAPFMNPYLSNVVDATRGEFDHLRNQALIGANQQATAAGAFGGSRAAAMAGARMGELDRAQASTIAGLHQSGWDNAVQQGLGYSEYVRALQERQAQEPLFRQQQAMNFLNLGMGPVGHVQQGGGGSNPLGSAAGGAMAGASFGPWGAAIGGGIGLLSGLFGG